MEENINVRKQYNKLDRQENSLFIVIHPHLTKRRIFLLQK